MSLADFQRALADHIASPTRCAAVRARGAEALADYELSQRELRRLVAMVEHRGMSTNCTLYRANRLTPLARTLPATCVRLGERFGPLLDEFFAAVVDCDLQWKGEGVRFARFLSEHPSLSDDVELQSLIAEEVAAAAVRYTTLPGQPAINRS